jgi:hypothetical protein
VVILAEAGLAVTCFALVDLAAGLLLISDFFVIAIDVIPPKRFLISNYAVT